MKNSDYLYNAAKRFQDSRKTIEDTFTKRMKGLESAKGSRFFEIESTKAMKEREDGLSKIKADFLSTADNALKCMVNASNSRTFEAPTAEEVAILDTLKMREKVSEGEIMKAGNTLKSPLAIEVLREIAQRNGFIRHIDGVTDTEMSMNEAGELIKALSKSIMDFVDYDTSPAARKAQEYKALRYGLTEEEEPLSKRAIFDTKEGFYNEIAPYMTGGRREAFFQATDGE